MRKKYITIDLDKARNLRYTLGSFNFIEAQTGKNFTAALADESMTNLTVLLFAGLKHEDKTLTMEQLGEMVDLENFAYVKERLTAAFNVGNPKSEPKVECETDNSPLSESQP